MWHDSCVVRLASLLILFASPSLLLAPAADAPAPEVAGEGSYDLDAAKADVQVILEDRGKAYLDARARLENNPKLAGEAVVARLEAVPAPSPEQRDRLLNVLGALRQPEHVAMFGEQLRGAMIHDRPTELWVQLLRQQGAAATPVLIDLVGDKKLSNTQRGELLELLVELTDPQRLGELMAMVGRGSSELQDTLRRALIRRARARRSDRMAIARGLDASLDAGDGETSRLAQLLILRAACCDADEAFVARLEGLASDAAAPFAIRVAAIDGLDRTEQGADVLEAVAREGASAALAGEQAAEILVTLALDGLPAERASALATEFALTAAEAPRLAELGYRHAKLTGDHSWLSQSQTHAWPEVRKQALARVAEAEGASCDKGTQRSLADIAGPRSKGGDKDARVGRAAVAALGRCGDAEAFKLLRELLEDTAVDVTQRAAAAKALAQHDPSGADHVAQLLLEGRYPDMARELVSALGHAAEPSETVRQALCRTSEANPMVASTAHASLSKLFPGVGCE